MQKLLLTTLVALGLAAAPAQASTVIAATAIASPNGELDTGAPRLARIIDQSGLSANYVSGVTDFAAFTAGTTHNAGLGLANTGVVGGVDGFAGLPVTLTFGFDRLVSLSQLALWNVPGQFGVGSFQIFAGAQALSGLLTADSPSGPAVPAQVFSFTQVVTDSISLVIRTTASTLTTDRPILGEVAFGGNFAVAPPAGVPAPGALLLFGLGLVGVVAARRALPRA
jgi:hypothetical protein